MIAFELFFVPNIKLSYALNTRAIHQISEEQKYSSKEHPNNLNTQRAGHKIKCPLCTPTTKRNYRPMARIAPEKPKLAKTHVSNIVLNARSYRSKARQNIISSPNLR